MDIIQSAGSHYTWQCADCETASSLHSTFTAAAAGYESHMDRHAEWEADEEAGLDAAECFERAMARRLAA